MAMSPFLGSCVRLVLDALIEVIDFGHVSPVILAPQSAGHARAWPDTPLRAWAAPA